VVQRLVQWHEELTLSRAILVAKYRGLSSPREIILTRKGEPHPIRTRDLLNGQIEDPLLQPGDVIELKR
jgi:hypothetical protein